MRRLLLAALAVLAVPAAEASAIVGGRPASEPYPHMTALFVNDDFRCGASLVRTDWVLTAAHCVLDERRKPFPRASFVLDPATRDVSRGPSANAVRAAELRVHPSYGTPTEDANDVALLRLERKAPAGAPIAFATGADRPRWEPGDPARVTGFGAEASVGVPVGGGAALREVDVPIVSDPDCRDAYGSGFDAATMVCAGEPLGTKDACQGDSGGPLTVVGASGARVLIGVVSFGFQCGFPQAPGVYARVGEGPLTQWLAANLPAPDAPTANEPAATPSPRTTNTGARTKAPAPRVGLRDRRARLDRKGRLPVRIGCAAGRRACRGSVTLSSRGKRVGRRTYRLAAGRTATVRVPVARRARRARTLLVRVSVAHGRTATRTLRVRR